YQVTKPDVLSKLEHGDKPWIIEDEIQTRTCPGIGKVDSHLQDEICKTSQNQRFLKSVPQCSEQNAFRNIVHLSKTHVALMQSHMFDLCRKALKSSLSLVNQKRRCEIKNFVELNRDEKSFLHGNHEKLYTGIKFPESAKRISTKF
ncbi:hypothetical protein HPG69_013991, partial [Diceros bicornis minor]